MLWKIRFAWWSPWVHSGGWNVVSSAGGGSLCYPVIFINTDTSWYPQSLVFLIIRFFITNWMSSLTWLLFLVMNRIIVKIVAPLISAQSLDGDSFLQQRGWEGVSGGSGWKNEHPSYLQCLEADPLLKLFLQRPFMGGNDVVIALICKYKQLFFYCVHGNRPILFC